MAVVRISNAKPGQCVAEDVKDRSGRILLAAESKLSDETIKILKSWGVVEVAVAGEVNEPVLSNGLSATELEQYKNIETDLERHFQFLNRSHPFIAELYDICLQRKLKELDSEHNGK